jgi:hypothetical protein
MTTGYIPEAAVGLLTDVYDVLDVVDSHRS